ncbi:SHD1 domain-containing protein [Verrucomicrobiales bacterium]|nr:SHD1 domain-containing protein [Verrucomicrobiales bacterium]
MKTLIHFLVFCLVATCNAELRTWTAVNGKEVEAEFISNEKGIVKLKLKSGKVFEVSANKLSKEDNEFISSLAKPEGVNGEEELTFSKEIAYLKDSDTPYTGKAFGLYGNGQKQLEGNYKDGEKDGLWTSWHENGQKKGEVSFKDGEKDGLFVEWHPNGQKHGEGNYKDGKPDGLALQWHENGQKQGEGNFKEGKEISAKYWNSKGEPVDSFRETVTETKPKQDGVDFIKLKIRENIYYLKGSETPYTGKSYALHPNGQKYFEANYKDGKKEGLSVSWDENGKKSSESNSKDGKKEGLEVFWYQNGQKRSEVNFKDGKLDGLSVLWFENGQKWSELNRKDGKLDGLKTSWHKNGQKRLEVNYKDGKEVEGSAKYWNNIGEPVDSREEAEKE